jgi:hypothetical protein
LDENVTVDDVTVGDESDDERTAMNDEGKKKKARKVVNEQRTVDL